ncbi:MAG: phosphotransferase [Gammaproteobacteria bacterium]|nr:phosphotransferase [Gammaproteobacteria bacterium]MCY4217785.1 phosphotransferase [Gammaproteobacteria bacterium]
MDDKKFLEVSQFLTDSGYSGSKLTSLTPDASFRQYHRLEYNGRNVMFMDAPPDKENLEAFIQISLHLQKLGIRCPKIYNYNLSKGFALIEDLGDMTFTRLLNEDADETALYSQAIHLLAKLHNNPKSDEVKLSYFNWQHFIHEAVLFVDWYLPLIAEKSPPKVVRDDFVYEWFEIYDRLAPLDYSLVLRDYHVDNLMQVDGECAVLDYQDALVGSCAYDFVSLLQDARRDIPKKLFKNMLDLYLSLREDEVERKDFLQHCSIFGAARHMKIAGIFARLWVRDNKPAYMAYMPRVIEHIAKSFRDPKLRRIKNWFQSLDVELRSVSYELSREQILKIYNDH